jgi:very-short-patch-repair endonuclease
VDFVNLEKKVVIELDGGQHAPHPGDRIRDEWPQAEGYKALRFWHNEVFIIEGVLETIRDALLTRRPDLFPHGERGYDSQQ